MHIDLSGHHVEITDGIRDAVKQKLEKVASHYPQLDSANVILTVEKNSQKIEVTTQYMGTTIAVQAEDHDLYAAISACAKKFEAKLSHKKGAVKANLHEKPVLTDEEDQDQAANG